MRCVYVSTQSIWGVVDMASPTPDISSARSTSQSIKQYEMSEENSPLAFDNSSQIVLESISEGL